MSAPELSDEDSQLLAEAISAYQVHAKLEEEHAIARRAEQATIVRLLPVGARLGGILVSAGARRFDPDRAREKLTPEQYAAICEPVPSLKLAEKWLPGGLVDQLYKPSASPVVRRVAP